MKNIFLTITTLFLGTQAFAGGNTRYGVDWDRGEVYKSSCAPESVEGNLKASERILGELAETPAFANATVFQNKISEISAFENNAEKIKAYFSLVGVDSSNAKQVVQFIGARNLAPYSQKAESTLALSTEQAQQLTSELSKALRGSL